MKKNKKQNKQNKQNKQKRQNKQNKEKRRRNGRPLFIICLTFVVIIILHFIINQLEAYLPIRHTQMVRETIFGDTLSSFQTGFQNLSIGIYMSRYNVLPREMRYLSETLMNIWPAILMVIFVSCFLIYYDVFTGIVFLILHGLMFYILFFSPWGKKCFDMARKRAELQLESTDEVSQKVMNIDHIFINQQESHQKQAHHEREEELLSIFYQTANHTNKMLTFLSFISVLAFSWVLYRGYRLSSNREHAFYHKEVFTRLLLTMCFFQNSVLKLYPRLVSLVQGFMTVQVFVSAIEMKKEEKDEKDEKEENIQKDGKGENMQKVEMTSSPILSDNFDIQIENLTFSYPSTTRLILKNWSMNIPHGSRVLLRGPSGSGKSTLMKLMIRFYEVEKKSQEEKYPIRIGGIEMDKIPLEELRRYVKYIPQTTHLLNESIVENILFGSTTYTERQVVEMVEKYKLERILGKDLNKLCGAEGKNISLGMQKVVILLRGLLQHSTTTIYLMDEPFAGLDDLTRESMVDLWENLLTPQHTLIISNHVPLSRRIQQTFTHTMDFQI
jgi:ABC-type branched-subunit amino acid transport system ATPase component